MDALHSLESHLERVICSPARSLSQATQLLTGVFVRAGTSDRHCVEALPLTKPTAKKKRRREAWCAETASELGEFGTQNTPGPATAATPAPAKQQKLSRTMNRTERIRDGLEYRKAKKSAGQLLPGSSPGSAQLAVAHGHGRDEMLPAPETSADSGAVFSGSDSDSPRNIAVDDEAGADAWAEVLAEQRDPQPSHTQTLPRMETSEQGDAAFESRPAELQQPEPVLAPAPKEISPSFNIRRSTRGIIAGDALNSPPTGVPQKGRQPAQQQDAACTLSFQGVAGKPSQRCAHAGAAKAPAAKRPAAEDTAKAEQMRRAANAIKAQKVRGALCLMYASMH